jgi:hypothetical protein
LHTGIIELAGIVVGFTIHAADRQEVIRAVSPRLSQTPAYSIETPRRSAKQAFP